MLFEYATFQAYCNGISKISERIFYILLRSENENNTYINKNIRWYKQWSAFFNELSFESK